MSVWCFCRPVSPSGRPSVSPIRPVRSPLMTRRQVRNCFLRLTSSWINHHVCHHCLTGIWLVLFSIQVSSSPEVLPPWKQGGWTMAETSYSTMTSTSTHMQAGSAQMQGGSAHMQISSAHMQTGTTHMQTGSTHMQADSAHMQVEQQWQGSYGVQQLASLPEVRGAWRSNHRNPQSTTDTSSTSPTPADTTPPPQYEIHLHLFYDVELVPYNIYIKSQLLNNQTAKRSHARLPVKIADNADNVYTHRTKVCYSIILNSKPNIDLCAYILINPFPWIYCGIVLYPSSWWCCCHGDTEIYVLYPSSWWWCCHGYVEIYVLYPTSCLFYLQEEGGGRAGAVATVMAAVDLDIQQQAATKAAETHVRIIAHTATQSAAVSSTSEQHKPNISQVVVKAFQMFLMRYDPSWPLNPELCWSL